MLRDDSVRQEDETLGFNLARFPIQLNLPEGDPTCFRNAREAIRREFRDSVKWKRLRCRGVTQITQTEKGSVYRLEIGHTVEFDWTWEGATAFRPIAMRDFSDKTASDYDNWASECEIQDSILWAGEVLEVDETNGWIFVSVADPEHPPTTGSFYVRPFEFLAFLDSIFHDPQYDQIQDLLPARLMASAGNIHPEVASARGQGLPRLQNLWERAWGVLWGPPGTGKTYTTGRQVASVLEDPSERILVVSTTNRATDAAAIQIGRAARDFQLNELAAGSILRIGKGASLGSYEREDLTELLQGTETNYLARIEERFAELNKTTNSEERALIRKEIKELREEMRDAGRRIFLDSDVRVVVSTAFRATTFLSSELVKKGLESGNAPFTTIFIDEAGLISRAAASALSLLASRRVVLVGDPKQLAPISKISRILPTDEMTWLANSGLSHLRSFADRKDGIHVLREQRRMHSDICSVVSSYQYDDVLTTAPEVDTREAEMPDILKDQPRAIWYVLDEHGEDLPTIRAERGPGNRSWVRAATLKILRRLFSDPTFTTSHGLFISPFKAQAKQITTMLAESGHASWSSSTVHSQQGSEADVVIFDTVNAGSYGWPYDEWKRLVNVALSRSRESVIFIASRAEMDEPYLRPLLRFLSPRVLRKQGKKIFWEEVPAKIQSGPVNEDMTKAIDSLGYQITKRRELRPVLSQEQERLCRLELDGKPRLVRGVAGSGKTVVLAHWLMQTVKRLEGQADMRIWAVFANRSLQSLIGSSIESAWDKETDGKPFPWDRVSLYHIREILDVLLPEVGRSMREFQYEYDVAAEAYLEKVDVDTIAPRCDALFIDEAQDLGPQTLKLLTNLVRQTDPDDANSRSVNIFFDNAQNIYRRGTPTWSEFGIDMRGRSTVMKESFRSTQPITEFALNVLYRLQPPESSPDHKELVNRGLIEKTQRSGNDWWKVRFNQVDGPKPTFRKFANLDSEIQGVADYCRHLIEQEGVQPADICLLYNGGNIKYRLENTVAPILAEIGVELSVQTNKPFERDGSLLLATTSNSFKGYDSEVVIIVGADQFTAKEIGILPNNLYVAMTRARSELAIFAQQMKSPDAQKLYEVLEDCLDELHERPVVDKEISPHDDLVDLLAIIGDEHRKWLEDLARRFKLSQEPIFSSSGEVVLEPIFSFKVKDKIHACFGKSPLRQRLLQRIEDLGIGLLKPGEVFVPSIDN